MLQIIILKIFQSHSFVLDAEDNCSTKVTVRKTFGCGSSYHSYEVSFNDDKDVYKTGLIIGFVFLGVGALFCTILTLCLLSNDTKREERRLQRQYEAARTRALESKLTEDV